MNPYALLWLLLARSNRICLVCGSEVKNSSMLEKGRCHRCRNLPVSAKNEQLFTQTLKSLVVLAVIIVVAIVLFTLLS